jgi:hypothetical protein
MRAVEKDGIRVEVSNILAVIDAEIAKLQQARALLAGATTSTAPSAVSKPRRGRPKGSKNSVTTATTVAPKKKTKAKRQLSEAGRKAIADAMKKRWAERRKQAAKAVAK